MINFQHLMAGMQTGTIDAKNEVYKMLHNMSPAQRQAAKNMLPKVEAMAKQVGICADGFTDEVSAHLS